MLLSGRQHSRREPSAHLCACALLSCVARLKPSRDTFAHRSSRSVAATDLAIDPAARHCAVGCAEAFTLPLCAQSESAHLRRPR